MTATRPSSPPSPQPDAAAPLCLHGHMDDGVGTTFGPVPGATLTVTPDELWLKGNRGDFRIPRAAVTKLSRSALYPWFFRGVRIQHRITGIPAVLRFNTMSGSTRELLARLGALGFPVA